MRRQPKLELTTPLFDERGRMNPMAQGETIMVPAMIGYPGSSCTDLIVFGERIQVGNLRLQATLEGKQS